MYVGTATHPGNSTLQALVYRSKNLPGKRGGALQYERTGLSKEMDRVRGRSFEGFWRNNLRSGACPKGERLRANWRYHQQGYLQKV